MLLRFLQKAEENIIAFLLVAMTLLVFADVVMRFGFGTGLLWSQELTLYLSAWFVMFGISYGLKVGAHIGVDAVVKLFPTHIQRVVSSIAVILCLVYCGLFLLPAHNVQAGYWNGGSVVPLVVFTYVVGRNPGCLANRSGRSTGATVDGPGYSDSGIRFIFHPIAGIIVGNSHRQGNRLSAQG